VRVRQPEALLSQLHRLLALDALIGGLRRLADKLRERLGERLVLERLERLGDDLCRLALGLSPGPSSANGDTVSVQDRKPSDAGSPSATGRASAKGVSTSDPVKVGSWVTLIAASQNHAVAPCLNDRNDRSR
jgi:hypothetical protein